MGIGAFVGRLLGSEKALEATVNGVTKGLDALVYTDEEKANDAAEDRRAGRAMVVGWMAATQGQNLARRIIALSITGTWLSMYVLAALAGVAAIFTNSAGVVTADKIREAGDIIKASATDMNPAVMLILAFYFAAPHMGDIAKAVTNKFSKDINKGA